MAEYIEREAVLKMLCAPCNALPEDEICPYRFTGCKQFYGIFNLPAADVAPVVRGEWMVSLERPVGTICSKCGFAWSDKIDAVKLEPILSKIKTNYCPNCGADMRGVATDTNVGDAET